MSLLQTASRAAQPVRSLASLRVFSSFSLTHPSSVTSTETSFEASSTGIATTTLGRLGSYISELMPSIVWASVPKSKTSHSKKRMRQATKGLKEQRNIVQCPGCGQAKLMHHLCTHCYRDMKGRGPSSNPEA